MAPLEARYAQAAADRADLLVALCGTNALISFDRIVESEVANLAERSSARVWPFSPSGDWFPDLGGFISPIEWANTAKTIDSEIRARGLNREQRRKLKRALFKESAPTAAMRAWLSTQSEGGDLTDILRLYPMRPQDAKVLARYTLGHASKDDAETAFLSSLRDPRWMMRWFAAHHDRLTPVIDWLRSPAKNMLESLKKAATAAQELYKIEALSGGRFRAEYLTKKGWHEVQDQLLLNIVNRHLTASHPEAPVAAEVELVDLHCPGLATAIRSIHSALRDSVGPNPRALQESDFIDGLHAMYAPYVSVFRADRHMSAHVRRSVLHHNTAVVSSLFELPDRIARALYAQGDRPTPT
jgi:hypothetical protein